MSFLKSKIYQTADVASNQSLKKAIDQDRFSSIKPRIGRNFNPMGNIKDSPTLKLLGLLIDHSPTAQMRSLYPKNETSIQHQISYVA